MKNLREEEKKASLHNAPHHLPGLCPLMALSLGFWPCRTAAQCGPVGPASSSLPSAWSLGSTTGLRVYTTLSRHLF